MHTQHKTTDDISEGSSGAVILSTPTGYFIVGLFCYICSFLLFVWLFFFTYALLAGLRFTLAEDRFFNTPGL
jgi:hypothetical protein